MDNVSMLPDTHNEVAGFQVTVDEVARVDVLQAMDLDIACISLPAIVDNTKSNSPTGLPALG
jgi:hypothetical protein